jgi:hypothetical protein
MGHGRGRLMMVLVYIAPMIVGGIAVLFMIKPLFARPANVVRSRSLTRQGEPLLFAFVDRLCGAVGAPRPKRIDVDCDINASAGFRRGLLSMLGNDLVLTIGVPLAAGLDINQFAGVLAHEFGHFTQGVGMRLTYVIRSISGWFTRVVYERDEWDVWLEHSTDDLDMRIAWVLYLAKLFVAFSRAVLWVLMAAGHVVAGFMLRQMEYDADRREARLVGSDVFESTARRLQLLGAAFQGAQADLSAFAQRRGLADNVPKLMLVNVDRVPSQVLKKLDEHLNKARTDIFDTHPADRDRIASVQRESTAPVFRADYSATVLFKDFDGLARNVTWDLYRGIFGSRFKPTDMYPVEKLLAAEAE